MKKAVTEFGTFEFDEVDNLIDELNSKELIMWNEVLNCAFSKFVSEDGTDLDTSKYDKVFHHRLYNFRTSIL